MDERTRIIHEISLTKGIQKSEAEERYESIERTKEKTKELEKWIKEESKIAGQREEVIELLIIELILHKYDLRKRDALLRIAHQIGVTEYTKVIEEVEKMKKMGEGL